MNGRVRRINKLKSTADGVVSKKKSRSEFYRMLRKKYRPASGWAWSISWWKWSPTSRLIWTATAACVNWSFRPGYRTKSGALFKARALQYCWEEEVNMLRDDDWIVHLDEETLLTENSVRGILNFCSDGQHPFGQGLITYANGKIVNWVTTLADSFRVADDM
ncbi:beta-1,4-mannosyltransferase egh protein, partial [Trichinella spiralis]|uniref:beta-1,4-mannosyltransferase egh protein n=1 Tax=Trichinella spiralis TaxID=6334 RepID=UPI0001EFDCD2